MPSRVRRLMRLALPVVVLPIVTTVYSQGQGGAQPAAVINQSTDPLLSAFRFRSIGPATMGGRIDDIAVSESDPNIIYIGYAVGGVWKSENNGTTFEPVFDTQTVASIGDIAIHPTNPNIVYVGTGEANNRQTSSFGDGIYKTTDGGKTWTHIGLKETQTIARIVIDPKSPETIYVASPGHLFGPNPDRGVFKSKDGGKTWNKIKYIDEDTGFTDIAIDPSNSNIIYAASYQRRRSGCCFNGGGPGSGIWKTGNGGDSWSKLNGNGLPPGTYGRIALDVARSNPNVLYAQIEAGEVGQPLPTGGRGADPAAATEATPPGAAAVTPPGGAPAGRGQRGAEQAAGGQAGGGQAGRGGGGGRGGFDWCNNGGPGRGFGGRGGGEGQPANQTPPALDPKRGGVLRSSDKGAQWTLVSNCNARPMYFSQLRVDPQNPDTIYVAGLPVAKSTDGGKTFATLDDAGGNSSPGHVDQHAIWVDPKNSKHIMIGNDGGFNVSWDQGKTWDFHNTMPTALSYWVSADMRHPYYVYTGFQDNGSWGGPSAVRGGGRGGGILNTDWFGIGGGDGFQTAVDPTDHNIVFTESQDGNTNRYDLRLGRGTSIRPRGPGDGRGGRGGGGGEETPAAAAGQRGGQPPAVQVGGAAAQAQGRGGPPNVLNAGPSDAYRFNWNTPFMLSPHNPRIVWLGGNRLFKSYNRGDTWVASQDLTRQVDRNKVSLMNAPGDRTQLSRNDGVVAYSTIISISESPVMPGVVWAGTDDGNLQVSRDGGLTFTEVGKNLTGLPANHTYWISRIDASHFDAGTAYVSVDGHRSDDLKPYVFVTRNYGQAFENISNNLPASGNVQVVREDPKNRNLLYVGTEFGLFISLDGGKEWKKFMNNYPTVRTDDILVHPRDNDLIIGSHGRSIWILDDITPLQQLTPAVLSSDATLFDIRPAIAYLNDQQRGSQGGGQKNFVGENAPRGTFINYYLKSAASGDVKITITDGAGKTVRDLTGTKSAGINRVVWNMTANPPQGQGQAQGFGGGGGGRGGGGAPTVEPGTYNVTLNVGGKTLTKQVTVLQDIWLSER
jgi:sortilin (neurotensin receptor 3)